MCSVNLSLSLVREYLSKSTSLISLVYRVFFKFVKLISVDNVFQELIHRLYIHFNPNVVVLYDGILSFPVVDCLVKCSCKSSVLTKVLVNELGKLL